MIINREQFNLGVDETRYHVLKFLTANPDKAYSLPAIEEAIFDPLRVDDEWKRVVSAMARAMAIGSALDHWVSQGAVDRKTIGCDTYYAIRVR